MYVMTARVGLVELKEAARRSGRVYRLDAALRQRGLANVVGTMLLVIASGFLVAKLIRLPGDFWLAGVDYDIYIDATRSWLAGGPFYIPEQVAGPYPIKMGHVLYPPNSLYLFAPFTVLPAMLWWAIPIAVTSWVVWSYRPSVLAWAFIVMALTVPSTWWRIIAGNPLLWIMMFLALGTRYRWPAALVLIKPTLAPFALVGIRSERWWVALGVLALASVPLLPMWFDYIAVLSNARGEQASPLYSLGDIPLMLIPLTAWLGRRAYGS